MIYLTCPFGISKLPSVSDPRATQTTIKLLDAILEVGGPIIRLPGIDCLLAGPQWGEELVLHARPGFPITRARWRVCALYVECDRKHLGQSYGRILRVKESFGCGRNDFTLTVAHRKASFGRKGSHTAAIHSFGRNFSLTVAHRKASFGQKGFHTAPIHSLGRNFLTAESYGCGRNSRNSCGRITVAAVRPKTIINTKYPVEQKNCARGCYRAGNCWHIVFLMYMYLSGLLS